MYLYVDRWMDIQITGGKAARRRWRGKIAKGRRKIHTEKWSKRPNDRTEKYGFFADNFIIPHPHIATLQRVLPAHFQPS